MRKNKNNNGTKQHINYGNRIADKITAIVEKGLKIDSNGEVPACIIDSYESFTEIYSKIIPKLLKTSDEDVEGLFESFFDLKESFNHIRSHIEDAEKSLEDLTSYLAEKVDKKTRSNGRICSL